MVTVTQHYNLSKQNGNTAPVSVVIPCFQCSTTIKRAIDSVILQTLRPKEVILVDDASGDETVKILDEFEKSYAWVEVVTLDENQGPGNARNIGWEASSQPYVAFLDADDTWHPKKIEIQYRYMRENPDIAISGHLCKQHKESFVDLDMSENIEIKIISAKSLLIKNAFSTPTVMLKCGVPFKFDPKKRYAEDLYLWQQIAFSGCQVTRIEAVLAYIHKAPYGWRGLSANLWQMEKGELSNFLDLYKNGLFTWGVLFFASAFSLIKYFRRLIITQFKK